MAWSKRQRITLMLVLDAVFFLVELIAGIASDSLALQADAFHMLNDVISLAIGLWAVTVASKATTDKYSYGWLRAEILGAFFNAVFLIALCISIILEATTRFLDPPEIKQPILILVVGCFGLCSNLFGFVVLGGHGHSHGHGHDHGAHGHSHGPAVGQDAKNQLSHTNGIDNVYAAEEGRAALPASALAQHGAHDDVVPGITFTPASTETIDSRRDTSGHNGDSHPSRDKWDARSSTDRSWRPRQTNFRQSRLTSIEDMSIHPASFRQDIIAASREHGPVEELEDDDNDAPPNAADQEPSEESPLLQTRRALHAASNGPETQILMAGTSYPHLEGAQLIHPRTEDDKSGGGGDHGHGDLGMNAMVLHVMGDALGNFGVIATAVVVWASTSPWRNYADPIVSLLITAIILRTALPLTMATARILLQATPDHIDVPQIRLDIQALDGVVSCHHMHIWQLSDDKLVASMHIRVGFAISDRDGLRYMELARRVRMCLHGHGIHSATIQPEFSFTDGSSSIDYLTGEVASSAASIKQQQHPAAADPAAAADPTHEVVSCAPSSQAHSSSSSSSHHQTPQRSDTSGRLPQDHHPPPRSPLSKHNDAAMARQLSNDLCLLECVENCNSKGCCSSVGTAVSSRSASLAQQSNHNHHPHP